MSFRRYPDYKDSGVDWLGQVPEHWDLQKLRRLFEIKKDIAGSLGYDVFSITQNGIRIKDLKSNEGQHSMDYSTYQLVRPGEFAMNPMDLITGGVGIAETVGVTSPDYRVCALRELSGCCPRYFLYLFQSIYRNRIFFAYGQGSSQLGRWRLPRQQFNNFVFPVPTSTEQFAIAAFLDREVAGIDALVAEQERLIELLTEKRQAVISCAVTRGLNPDAPMKDSGVEWLGEVPAHWEVGQSRRMFGLRNERARDGDRQLTASQKHGVIYQDDFMRLEDQRVVQVIKGADILKHVEPGDFVISMRSFQGGIEWCQSRGCISSAYVMLAPGAGIHGPFFARLFKSSTYIQALQTTSNLVRDGQAMRFDNFAQVDLPRVPMAEQIAISEFLDAETAKVDALVEEARRAITLLQERRTALISAAVTGQIDVQKVEKRPA